MTTLTIDIGGTRLAATLVENNLQVRERHELPTPASKTPQALRTVLQALVAPLQGRANRMAIASTGIIREGALLALDLYSLGGLVHFPLTQTLEQITDLPTLAVNDAQTAAWTRYHALGGEYRDLVFIAVPTGVDGGVVSGGRLLTEIDGPAGHPGHALVDPHGPTYGYGCVGCIEAIASGRGIAAAAEGTLAGCDAETIFSCARQGDEQASQLIHHSARTLTRLVTDVKAMTDYQIVVIGSSVGLAEGYLAPIEHYLTQKPLAYHMKLLAAHYRHDIELLGAALLTRGE